jgi:tRNA (cmo5U34)-methyltransferase
MSDDLAERFTAGGWQFTDEVAAGFGPHVRASVPFYDDIQAMIAEASDWLVPAGGRVADLGAATGATCCAIAARHPEREIVFDLYDTSEAMLSRAIEAMRATRGGCRVVPHVQEIQQPMHHVGADLTIAAFTLQFLPVPERQRALRIARERAAQTGALIVAEKLRPVDSRWAEIAHDVSHDWKAEHGITAEAIRAKARALRGVLVPLTQDQLYELIETSGWMPPEVLFRWHQWVVLGAFAEL